MKKMTIDTAHSEIGFKLKHLMISPVRGIFSNFGGSMEGETENMTITFSLETSSVNTNNSQRDGHLKSSDFFDSENYPTIEFKAEGVNMNSKKISGDLTIKGVTKKVDLDVQYNGVNVDPWGNTKHGFEVTGIINRVDFGLTWNSPLDTGGVLVGEEVKLNLDIQMLEMEEELETTVV